MTLEIAVMVMFDDGVGGAGVRLDDHGLGLRVGERDAKLFHDVRLARVPVGVFFEAKDADDVVDGDATGVFALGFAHLRRGHEFPAVEAFDAVDGCLPAGGGVVVGQARCRGGAFGGGGFGGDGGGVR